MFWIMFVIAAGVGAYLRYPSSQLILDPWTTLLVNVIGSALIGFLALYLERYSVQFKSIVLIAFLGSLTTFSSYSLDIVKLFSEGQWSKVFLYFFLSNGLCLLGCFIGWKFAQNFVNAV